MRGAPFVGLIGCDAQVTIIESSKAGATWSNKGTTPWGPAGQATTYITLNRSAIFQTMMGFGSALTDTSAINFLMMNDTSKAAFLTSQWGTVEEGGLGYTGK